VSLALSSDQGIIIAKRSISLSKTFVIIGIFLACLSVLIANVPHLAGNSIPSTIPINGTEGINPIQSISYIAVPLQVFAALLFSTPVLLLYVYDKNNGVLEYFLSLGKDQSDIYREYLKSALILASVILIFEVALNGIVGLLERTSAFVLVTVPVLVVIIALPVVTFTTLAMMAFSSLQKQRVGSNQPLGLAIGVFAVLPAYIAPLVVPSATVILDSILAAVVVGLSIVLFFLSSRLISREKFLP